MALQPLSLQEPEKYQQYAQPAPVVEAPPVDNRSFVQHAKDDLVNTVTNYFKGAVQGANELQKAQDQYYGVSDNVVRADQIPSPTVQNQQYVADAQKAFMNETVLPTMAFIPGATLPAVGMMLADGAKTTYDQTEGTPLEKAGNAVRSVTYGPAVDMYNDPNTMKNLSEKPISTGANIILAGAQAALPIIGARRGYKYADKKIGDLKAELVEHVENKLNSDLPNMDAYKSVNGLDALDQLDSPTRGFRPATPEEMKQWNTDQQTQARQPLLSVLDQIKSQKFDDANGQAYKSFMERQQAESDVLQAKKNEIAGSVLMSPLDRMEVGADLPVKTRLGGQGEVLGDKATLTTPSEIFLRDKPVPQEIIKAEQPRYTQPQERPFLPSAEQLIDERNINNIYRDNGIGKSQFTPHQELVNSVERQIKLQSGLDPTFGKFDNLSVGDLANKAIDKIADKIWNSETPTKSQLRENRVQVSDRTSAKINELYPDTNNPVKKWVQEDVKPTGNAVLDAMIQAKDGVKKLFSPASSDDASRLTARAMRDHSSGRKLEMERTQKSLQVARDSFDKLTKAEQVEIAIKMQEPGYRFSNPHIQGFVDSIREQLHNRAVQLKEGGFLDKFDEYYLPQLWKETSSNTQKLAAYSNNPLNAPSGFLKKKVVPNYKAGIQLGLEPKYTNPVEMALSRIGEMDKFLTSQKVIKEMTDNGLMKKVKAGEEIPEGWKKINDDIDSQFGSAYYAPESAARVINNSLSPSFRGAKAFSYYMNVANTMNQLQLIGGFHAGFTSLDTAVTKNGLGIKQLSDSVKAVSEGNYAKAGENAISALKNFAEVPISPVTNAIAGSKFKDMLLDKSHDNNPLVQMYKAGGGQIGMDAPLMTNYRESFIHAINDKNFIGAALRAPLAGAEKISSYIVEKLVPFQKLGAFKELAEYEIKKDPSILTDRNKMREVGAKIIDTIDNRLGQMSYDNLFWDRKLKDFLMGTMRAPGWTGGTIREIGGGILDLGNNALTIAGRGAEKLGKENEIAKRDLEFTHRMSYVLSLPITTAVLGITYQMMTTGKPPDDIKSLIFPKNGNVDSSGHEQRVSFPSYMKDVYHWASNPIQTGINKMHPILSTIGQLWQNKDFYGTEIANPKDSALERMGQKLGYVAKSIVPFSIKGYQQVRENGGSVTDALLPQIGLTPAPSDISKSKAEMLASEYAKDRLPAGAKTQESAEKSQMKGKIVQSLMKGDKSSMVDALKSKSITPQEAKQLQHSATMTPLQRSVERLSVEQSIEIYQQADSKERESLKVMIQKKIGNSQESAQIKKQNMNNLLSIK